ncbi:hypothetical protein PLICRDRAFT_42637 [Plicaturopsis crispa FD-325 SS-3]|nr:hypothetical protein PLICRDRAFT_42637 [Plicaturopsis crispa FD-325 SS-3]
MTTQLSAHASLLSLSRLSIPTVFIRLPFSPLYVSIPSLVPSPPPRPSSAYRPSSQRLQNDTTPFDAHFLPCGFALSSDVTGVPLAGNSSGEGLAWRAEGSVCCSLWSVLPYSVLRAAPALPFVTPSSCVTRIAHSHFEGTSRYGPHCVHCMRASRVTLRWRSVADGYYMHSCSAFPRLSAHLLFPRRFPHPAARA